MAAGVVRFWEQRTTADPANTIAWNNLGSAYIRQARQTGDVAGYARAEAALNASLAVREADNYAALGGAALVLNTQHRFAEAIPLAERAITQDPSEAFAYGALGDAYLALGRYSEARSAFDTMLALDTSLESLSRDAFLRQILGDLDGAEASWRAALAATRPTGAEDAAWLHTEAGRFFLNTARPREAEAQARLAIEAFGGYVPAFALLGDVAAAGGDLPLAAAYYDAVVARRPAPEYAMALGAIYEALGDHAAAEIQYGLVDAARRLYEANGILTGLQFARYWADRQINMEQALAEAEALYVGQPGIYTADALAWVYFRSGDTGRAAPLAREAIALGTRDPLVLYHAAAILAEAGDSATALTLIDDALALNPAFSVRFAADATALRDGLHARVATP
jgi:tetratricopeptide (TPR) repeat protein